MYFHISNSYTFRASRHTGCLLPPCNVCQYLTQRLVCHCNAALAWCPRCSPTWPLDHVLSSVNPRKFCASTPYHFCDGRDARRPMRSRLSDRKKFAAGLSQGCRRDFARAAQGCHVARQIAGVEPSSTSAMRRAIHCSIVAHVSHLVMRKYMHASAV